MSTWYLKPLYLNVASDVGSREATTAAAIRPKLVRRQRVMFIINSAIVHLQRCRHGSPDLTTERP